MWPHPYWISAGGWCCRPFWDHYLVTGDLEFLRKRVVPALKELALFYEDFLTVTDKDGKYIFVPSFSPENNPANTEPFVHVGDQRQHGHRGVQGSADQSDPGFRDPGHRRRQRAEMEGDAGQRCRPTCSNRTAP